MKIKDLIIIGLFLFIAYLWQCRKPIVKETLKEVRITDTIYSSDTIVNYITNEHFNLVPVVISDTNRGIDLSDTSLFWSTYLYKIQDSLLDASIIAHSQMRPKIDFKYTLKNYEIKDTILIKDSVYREGEVKSCVLIGSELSGNKNNFGFSPSLTYSHKKGVNYSLRYDIINNIVGFKVEKKF